jgi:hypothetical protein
MTSRERSFTRRKTLNPQQAPRTDSSDAKYSDLKPSPRLFTAPCEAAAKAWPDVMRLGRMVRERWREI